MDAIGVGLKVLRTVSTNYEDVLLNLRRTQEQRERQKRKLRKSEKKVPADPLRNRGVKVVEASPLSAELQHRILAELGHKPIPVYSYWDSKDIAAKMGLPFNLVSDFLTLHLKNQIVKTALELRAQKKNWRAVSKATGQHPATIASWIRNLRRNGSDPAINGNKPGS